MTEALSRLVSLTKKQIRTRILLKLKVQKEEDRRRKSCAIKKKLFRTRAFQKAKKVMFYVSFKGEVNTADMIREARDLGKIVTVPVCRKDNSLQACILNGQTRLIRGRYGTWEPVPRRSLRSSEIDLVVVPAVAFTKSGKRLGRGKGYYDRFLKTIPQKTVSIGLAFDFQILPSLPTHTSDVSVKKIIFA